MNKITRYRPTYFNGFPHEEYEFETLEEMLRIPFVKSWKEGKDFCYFAVSEKWLMAILCEGREWWVVGKLDNPEINLSRWTGRER